MGAAKAGEATPTPEPVPRRRVSRVDRVALLLAWAEMKAATGIFAQQCGVVVALMKTHRNHSDAEWLDVPQIEAACAAADELDGILGSSPIETASATVLCRRGAAL